MLKRPPRLAVALVLAAALCATVAAPKPACAAAFSTKIFRSAAIGAAVTAIAPQLNKFVNTLTFNNRLPSGTTTRVVPVLSVGEKGYIGAAQVAGPSSYVNQVKAIWAYDDSFSSNEFRLRILVPSNSFNPLALKKVQKVGITAVIDVALDGRYNGETYSRKVSTGDLVKTGAVALAVNAAAKPINRAINTVTRGMEANTKVVPAISVGEKAYIGGVQVSGPASAVSSVKAAYQYEAAFDTGKYRVKAFVPAPSVNPLKISRVKGVGITALIDTSIADQEKVREREVYWRTARTGYRPIDATLSDRFRGDIRPAVKHDNGLHKGWYIGKGNQKKALSGIWSTRYQSLPSADRPAFMSWWNNHLGDSSGDRERAYREWIQQRRAPADKPFKAEFRDFGKKKDKEQKSEGRGWGNGKHKK